MLNLYQEIVMDHYKNPRNRGKVDNATFTTEQRNSSCGDEIMCSGIVQDNVLIDVRFDGKGCVISQATASLLSEKVKGLTLEAIVSLDKEYMNSLVGITLGPVRMQCALLSLAALQKGINEYKNRAA